MEKGKHVKKTQFQLYKCKEENCTGTKKARVICSPPQVKNQHDGRHWKKKSKGDLYRDILYLTPYWIFPGP